MVAKKIVKKEAKGKKEIKAIAVKPAKGEDDDDEEEAVVQEKDLSISEEEAARKAKALKKVIESIPAVERNIVLKGNKPIEQLKKGDKVKVDGKELEVDTQYVMIDHGSAKEMAIELFDAATDKDYQLRYFNNNIKESIEFYELNEILYSKKPFMKIEW